MQQTTGEGPDRLRGVGSVDVTLVEDLAEIYHRFYLTDHLSLSLLAQYAFHLAGDEEIDPLEGVFLGGFLTQVNF